MFEVIRVEKTKDYTVISNRHLKDIRLSLKAKGLLTMMLSLPDGTWELSIEGLSKICKDGKSAVTSALKELESAGYYSKRKVRENGMIVGWIHTVSEIPQSDFPVVGNQDMENSDVGNSDMENQPQLNTKELNTNQLTTYESNTEKNTLPHNLTPPFKNQPTQTEYDEIMSLWNTIPHTRNIDEIIPLSRRDNELRICISHYGMDGIRKGIKKIEESKWLQKQGRVSFDTFMKLDTFQKLMEGAYDEDFRKGGKTDGFEFGW